jgi:DNA repair protein RadC
VALRPVDPTEYEHHVVSFSVVRESAEEKAGTRPVLSEPTAVTALARQIIADDAKEHFWILMLNAQNRLVAGHEVSTGTLSASLVHPREVFGPALRVMGVSSLVLLHNHPSGDPVPSPEDLRLTRQLVDASKLLDLQIHDHVIIGNGTDAYVSLASRGDLWRTPPMEHRSPARNSTSWTHDSPSTRPPIGQKADSAELGVQACGMLAEGVNQGADEESLRRERSAAFGRWVHEQRQRRSSAGPRDCCLVSPETANEHGHPLDDAHLAGTDDALAEAAFKRRAREAASSPRPSPLDTPGPSPYRSSMPLSLRLR